MNLQVEEEDDEVQRLANMIHSTFKSVQFEGLVGIKRVLSGHDRNVAIQKVISSRIVPKILEFLTWKDDDQFQIETFWCISNICAGKERYADYMLELGSLDIVINFFDSSSKEIVHNAIWVIGNIASSSIMNANLCLQKDCMSHLLRALESFSTFDEIVQQTLGTISILTRAVSLFSWESIVPALPVLHKHVSNVISEETLSYALRSLKKLSAVSIQEIIDQGCVPFILQHLENRDEDIVRPALKIVRNLFRGNASQRIELLKFVEFSTRFWKCTYNFNEDTAHWATLEIKNRFIEGPEHLKIVIQNDEDIKILKTILKTEPREIANEATQTICKIISGAKCFEIIHQCLLGDGRDLEEIFLGLSPEPRPGTRMDVTMENCETGSGSLDKYISYTPEFESSQKESSIMG